MDGEYHGNYLGWLNRSKFLLDVMEVRGGAKYIDQVRIKILVLFFKNKRFLIFVFVFSVDENGEPGHGQRGAEEDAARRHG